MNIVLNGKICELEEGTSIQKLVEAEGFNPLWVVAELNTQIVAKEKWEATRLEKDDRLELVGFVGGG